MQVIYFRQLSRHVHSNQQNSAEWHHVTPHCLAPLEKICSGLGISLSQFFQEEDSVYLTTDQKEILDLWAKLSPAQRTAVSQMLRSFLYIKEEV